MRISRQPGMNLAGVFAARSELNKQLLEGAVYRKADISRTTRDYLLDLGAVTAKIYAMGLNHTLGDTVVLVEGVLFSGDVAMRPQPSIMNPQATITQWLASLDKLDAMKPVHVVPSQTARRCVHHFGLSHLSDEDQDRAAALKKEGKTLEQTTQVITDEMSGQYPDKQRLAGAVRGLCGGKIA